jgi:hypothetical protein
MALIIIFQVNLHSNAKIPQKYRIIEMQLVSRTTSCYDSVRDGFGFSVAAS